MKSKLITAQLVVIGITAILGISVNAAVLSFTDRGLEFEINDDDPFAPTITFSDRMIVVPNSTISVSKSRTVSRGTQFIPQPFPDPPLEIETFATMTATIDTAVAESEFHVAGRTSSLTFTGVDSFAIGRAFSGLSGSFVVPVIWSVEGYSETVTGSFDWLVSPGTNLVPTSINTALYPDDVFLNDPLGLYGAYYENIAISLDGELFEFTVGGTYTQLLGSDPVFTVGVAEGFVPVPPAVWLLGSGLLGLAGIARRRA